MGELGKEKKEDKKKNREIFFIHEIEKKNK